MCQQGGKVGMSLLERGPQGIAKVETPVAGQKHQVHGLHGAGEHFDGGESSVLVAIGGDQHGVVVAKVVIDGQPLDQNVGGAVELIENLFLIPIDDTQKNLGACTEGFPRPVKNINHQTSSGRACSRIWHTRLRVRNRNESPGEWGSFARRRDGAMAFPNYTRPNSFTEMPTVARPLTHSTPRRHRCTEAKSYPTRRPWGERAEPCDSGFAELTGRIATMTDLEWARAFVGCKIEGTGYRFSETVEVLVKKLAQVREEASGHMPPGTTSECRGGPEPSQQQVV